MCPQPMNKPDEKKITELSKVAQQEKSCSMFFLFVATYEKNRAFLQSSCLTNIEAKSFYQFFQLNFSFDCSDTAALVEKGIFLSLDQG